MDLDLSSLWSWTVPLWGLFLVVMFLGGVLMETTVLQGLPTVLQGLPAKGGARRVRFSLPHSK